MSTVPHMNTVFHDYFETRFPLSLESSNKLCTAARLVLASANVNLLALFAYAAICRRFASATSKLADEPVSSSIRLRACALDHQQMPTAAECDSSAFSAYAGRRAGLRLAMRSRLDQLDQPALSSIIKVGTVSAELCVCQGACHLRSPNSACPTVAWSAGSVNDVAGGGAQNKAGTVAYSASVSTTTR